MGLTLIASGIYLLFGIWSVLPSSIKSLSSANVSVRDSSAAEAEVVVGSVSQIFSSVRACPVILQCDIMIYFSSGNIHLIIKFTD